ncbi:MAG: ABC transporter permease [Alphaproteobacteria bacterium]|nr:ABC transporter permease [Alphaproteobacteria bacterium]
MEFLEKIGEYTIMCFSNIGKVIIFCFSGIHSAFTRPFYFRQFLDNLVRIGFYSIPVVGMTALFTGAVLVLQTYTGFSRFSGESTIPTVVVLSITRELGPVLAGLMVAGRVGSSIAAEIATMKVSEQIDALKTLSVNPVRYLVAPRILACTCVMPILVLIADVIGILGGYLVATEKLDFNKALYLSNTVTYLEAEDVISGLIKAAIFGFIIAVSGCYSGCNANKGAESVGTATINAVVMSSVLILFFNYITTQIFFTT